MSTFEMINADKGEVKETKSVEETITIEHVRKMIQERQTEIARIEQEIVYWQEKETAIMSLPEFVEPKAETIK